MSLIAPVKPYFRYAMELSEASPVMAYYCKLYAVQKGLDLIKKAPQAEAKEAQKFLLDQMADLENMKKKLGDVKSEETKYQVENFILSVFAKVDKDERTAEKITKQHAVDFNRCGHFIALLTCFGPLDAEW